MVVHPEERSRAEQHRGRGEAEGSPTRATVEANHRILTANPAETAPIEGTARVSQ